MVSPVECRLTLRPRVAGRVHVKHAPVSGRLGLAASLHRDSLRHALLRLSGNAVWIGQHQLRFVQRLRFQIENAAREHVRGDHIEHAIGLKDALALQPQQRKRLSPLPLALLAIRHVDARSAIVIALNQPLKTKIDQRRMVHDELARRDLDDHVRRNRAIAKSKQREQKQQAEKPSNFHGSTI